MSKKFKHLNLSPHWQQYFSKYPDGYTIIENLIDWVSQVDDMVDNVNDWNKYLVEFVETFDTNLQTKVIETLSEWQDSGFLDVVISKALQWELDNYITTNEQDKLTITAQLSQTNNKIKITPDDFDGSDVEKIQQVLDFAISNSIDVVHLNRLYDITGGTIYMPVDNFWGFLTFEGGHIRKDDAGFIFNRNVGDDNKSCNSPMFINTKFSSESDGVYLYNGNRMIRHNLTNCIFHKVGLATSNTYLQSVRLSNCETGQLGTHFVDSKMVYDFSFNNHRAESSTSSDYHLIKVITDKVNDISYFGLRITNSLIEGYNRINPIQLGTGYGLKIDGTYFEANNVDIKIDKGVGTSRIQGSIKNCVFGDALSTYILEIEWGVLFDRLTVEDNTSDIKGGQYFSNRDVFNGGRTNNLYAGGTLSDSTRMITRDSSYPINHLNLGSEGVSFEIPLINLGNVGGNLYDVDEKQFLVNFKFTFGSSAWYSAHLTGILSIDGVFKDGAVKQELLFTELSERNTKGNASTTEPIFEYYFKETNSKNAESTGTPNLTIVFKFPEGVHSNKNHGSFIPIRRILGQYTSS